MDFQRLCEYDAKAKVVNSDYFESPGIVSWLFQFVFWWIFAGAAYSSDHSIFEATNGKLQKARASDFAILYLGVPGITNAVNWYLTASTYTTQCFIFGALIGAHMAEAMFVKHLGLMKD